jgi:predicted DNA-binding mobile mystery protein A
LYVNIKVYEMAVKHTVSQQYRSIADRAARHSPALKVPPEGWLRTVRQALGMSGAQLARRMGVTRARIAQAETAEKSGGVTLKSMQAAAEAMGCRFVYAIVPPDKIEEIVIGQARKKAKAIVLTAGKHMALEDQALSPAQMDQEITRLTHDIVHEMPSGLWNDP